MLKVLKTTDLSNVISVYLSYLFLLAFETPFDSSKRLGGHIFFLHSKKEKLCDVWSALALSLELFSSELCRMLKLCLLKHVEIF